MFLSCALVGREMFSLIEELFFFRIHKKMAFVFVALCFFNGRSQYSEIEKVDKVKEL